VDYCGQCGASLRADQRFCRKCGISLCEQRAVANAASTETQAGTYPATTNRTTLPSSGSTIPGESQRAAHESGVPFAALANTDGRASVSRTRRRRKSFREMTRRDWLIAAIVGIPLGILFGVAVNGSISSAHPAVAPSVTIRPAAVHPSATRFAPAVVVPSEQPTDTVVPTANPTDMAALKAQVSGVHICRGTDYGGSMPICGKDASSLSQSDIDAGAGISFASPVIEPSGHFPAGSYTLTVYEIDSSDTPNQIGTLPLDMKAGNGYIGWKMSDVISLGAITLNPNTTYVLELDGPVSMGVAGQARFVYTGDGALSTNTPSANGGLTESGSSSASSSLASDEGGTGPTAECNDGTTSYSQHPSGTCSYHGGVAMWDDHLSHSTP